MFGLPLFIPRGSRGVLSVVAGVALCGCAMTPATGPNDSARVDTRAMRGAVAGSSNGRADRLVFGNNPRQGYFNGGQFVHPELRFRLTFPEGWTAGKEELAVLAVSPGQDAAVELSQATEPSADSAARAFMSQPGITGGSSNRARSSGLRSVTMLFAAATDHGMVRGAVLFVEYGDAVYRVLGFAPEARWPGYRARVERALRSFRSLTNGGQV